MIGQFEISRVVLDHSEAWVRVMFCFKKHWPVVALGLMNAVPPGEMFRSFVLIYKEFLKTVHFRKQRRSFLMIMITSSTLAAGIRYPMFTNSPTQTQPTHLKFLPSHILSVPHFIAMSYEYPSRSEQVSNACVDTRRACARERDRSLDSHSRSHSVIRF